MSNFVGSIAGISLSMNCKLTKAVIGLGLVHDVPIPLSVINHTYNRL